MMSNGPKQTLFIVAGEASGDFHGARLVQALHKNAPDQYQITAIGGQYLADQPQVEMLHNLAQYGVTGFSEVLRHIRVIRHAYRLTTTHLKKHKPALLILIDYPGFNLRLAKYAKSKLDIKILYYISPQVWAWKAGRLHTIKKYIDHMAVILPFEKGIYEQANIPCTFVGHPLLDNLLNSNQHQARQALNFKATDQVIALLPGSRYNELHYHLPMMIGAVKTLLKTFPHLQFIIPVASSLNVQAFSVVTQEHNLPIRLTHESAQLTMAASDFVVVASGTASLECALLIKPMCIIYKSSLVTSLIVNKVVKIKYAGLCNLIANRMIVPELLQDDCTPQTITEIVSTFLTQPHFGQTMRKNLLAIKHELANESADASLEEIIPQLIHD